MGTDLFRTRDPTRCLLLFKGDVWERNYLHLTTERNMIPYETAPPGTPVSKEYLWPPKCTLSFYSTKGDLLGRFGQRWRRLDLADTLMFDVGGNSRMVIFGIRSDSVKQKLWDEESITALEALIRHDFGGDGYKVSIRRETALGESRAVEFRWHLKIHAK